MVTRTFIFTTVGLFLSLGLSAQTGSSGDATGGTTMFEVDDIRVIHSPADNELVSMIVGFDGGYVDGLTDNPALPSITASVLSTGGSAEYDKNALRRFLARTSTRLSGDADRLGIRFTMTATRERFPEAWKVLRSILVDPLYDPIEFRNEIQRMVAETRNAFTNPERQAYRLADSLLTHTHPLIGRYTYEADVDAIEMDDVRSLWDGLKQRSRMLVVVVGKVTEAEIRKMLAPFSSWPKGDFERPEVASLEEPEDPAVLVVNRTPLPTTYVYGAFTGPEIGDDANWPLTIGMSYLRAVLFQEIRTKRNLSYAPFAFLRNSYGLGLGVVGVSSIHPDSAAGIILHEIEKMKDGEFSESELEAAKQVYITRFYMGEMTNAAKAARLYYGERFAGDWTRAFAYDDILAVTREDVQEAFEEYAENIQFGIVGDESGVTRAIYVADD